MSKKTFSVDEILWAFLENAKKVEESVAVSVAGEPWGYVRIKGPSGKHQVVIERYNATVALGEVHSGLTGVKKRPDPKVGIEEDPLGCSSGPTHGSTPWGISAKSLLKEYGSPAKFVETVVQACAKTGTPW